MKFGNGTGPQRCKLCLRDKTEILREHLSSKKTCCPQCPFKDLINDALNHPNHYIAYIHPEKEKDNNNNEINKMEEVKKLLIKFLISAVITISVYLVTYEVMEFDQTWAIVAAIFWPITLSVALIYYVGCFIIGLL